MITTLRAKCDTCGGRNNEQVDAERAFEGHTLAFTVQSGSDGAVLERVFPRGGVPKGHVMDYRWETDANGYQKLYVGAVHQSDVQAPEVIAAGGKPLDQMSIPDLQTKAGELGVKVDPKWDKRMLLSEIRAIQNITVKGK